MKQTLELLETGVFETYSPPKKTTVKAILEKLGIGDRYFGLLLNGKNVDPDTEVETTDSIVILPQIAGG